MRRLIRRTFRRRLQRGPLSQRRDLGAFLWRQASSVACSATVYQLGKYRSLYLFTVTQSLGGRITQCTASDFKTASTMDTATVHSKLDCLNSFYHTLSNVQFNRLQQINNSLAFAVFITPRSTHITTILRSLH